MLPLVVGSNVGHSLHDLSRIEETNKTFFLFSHLMTSPRDHKDLDLLLVDAQLRCAHEDQLCLGAQGPYVQQAIFMRVLITRYPASEDRLIVRPLLCRRCALRLQPAEPQPYIDSKSPFPPGNILQDGDDPRR